MDVVIHVQAGVKEIVKINALVVAKVDVPVVARKRVKVDAQEHVIPLAQVLAREIVMDVLQHVPEVVKIRLLALVVDVLAVLQHATDAHHVVVHVLHHVGLDAHPHVTVVV